MPNIMINQVCNLKCPYCFANEYVNKDGLTIQHSRNITEENFEIALDYLDRAHTRAGIIGGEPLLHPQFRRFIELASQKRNLPNVLVFTNGINLGNFVDLFSCGKFRVLVNCNSPEDIGKHNYNKLLESLDKAFSPFTSDRIELGINMYKKDFEFEYMLDLLKRYKKKSVRVSVSVPNNARLKNTEPLVYFDEMLPRVKEFFAKLLEIECVPHLDCNYIPICKLDDKLESLLAGFEELAKKNNVYFNLRKGSNCSPVIDIMPDLTVSRCFGISDNNVRLTNFRDLHELTQFFKSEYDYLGVNIPVDKSCNNCLKFITNDCQGGCLAFKKPQIEQLKVISRNIYIDRRELQ